MQKFTDIQKEILKQIDSCATSLKIAVTWFTNREIFDSIIKGMREKQITVELVVLNDRINNKQEGVAFQDLIDLGGKFYYSSNDSMVHHKFCIIDEKIVITGSYNWTYYAENRNWENVVILGDEQVVKAYVEEFNKVIAAHTLVSECKDVAVLANTISDLEYLTTDYVYQAKVEKENGNDLEVGRIYTQLLKLNSKQPDLIKERSQILEKYNQDEFLVSPFEIGIPFQKKYEVAIPAFQKLPYSITKKATTIEDNQRNVLFRIQKHDIVTHTFMNLTLKNIRPAPKSVVKLEWHLELKESGLLTVTVNEIAGNERSASGFINIKELMPGYRKKS